MVEYRSVLDHGFVKLIDHMGTDLSVVNAARISFGKRKDEFDEKDAQLVEYLTEHEHCYDDATEVMTQRGWVAWPEVVETDKLAAVDPHTGMFQFETPIKFYKSAYSGDMVSVSSKQINLLVTPGHRMWIKPRVSGGKFGPAEFRLAKDLPKGFRVCATARLDLPEGDAADYYKGFVYGFFLGDGCRASTGTVTFHLSKQRKIAALTEALTNTSLQWKSKTRATTNNTVITVYTDDPLYSGKSANKRINSSFLQGTTTNQMLTGIWDGLLQSDGSKKRSAFSYSSTSKGLLSDVITLGTLLGKYVKYNKNTGQHASRVMILSRSESPRIDSSTGEITTTSYTGDIYCAEVSTGLLLVRRNGCQAVCGNSAPFRHAYATFHVKAPIAVMRQWMKHRIASDFNEISGRYVNLSNTDIYYPAEFRKQAVVNKQGSLGSIDPYNISPAKEAYTNAVLTAVEEYNKMLELGVCREQARLVLPLGLYTEVYWTVSMQAAAHFVHLRTDSHAQWEIQEYANVIDMMMRDLYPQTFGVLVDSLKNQ